MARAVAAGGGGIFQLRVKDMADRELLEQARAVVRVAAECGIISIVNDRADIAIAAGADGVHLGQDDLPIAAVRTMSNRAIIVGKSTHTLEQARGAIAEGADYIGVGPVFATPTKPEYRSVGLELVRAVARECPIPFYAIGGIDLTNLGEVLSAGAWGVAVVRAVCGSQTIAEQTREFIERIAAFHRVHSGA